MRMDIIAPTQAGRVARTRSAREVHEKIFEFGRPILFEVPLHTTAGGPSGSRVAETAHPTLHLPISKTGGAVDEPRGGDEITGAATYGAEPGQGQANVKASLPLVTVARKRSQRRKKAAGRQGARVPWKEIVILMGADAACLDVGLGANHGGANLIIITDLATAHDAARIFGNVSAAGQQEQVTSRRREISVVIGAIRGRYHSNRRPG